MFSNEPVSRLSMQITWCPSPSRCSQRWEPRNPAPPVTTQVLIGTNAIGGGGMDAVRPIPAISGNSSWKIVQEGGEKGFGLELVLAVFGARDQSGRGEPNGESG